jgi:hypothetical protein
VLPWAGSLSHKGTNAYQTNKVRDALRTIAPELGMRFPNPEGWPFQRRSHVIWDVEYDGRFPPTAITVEAAMRPVVRPPRRTQLRTILAGPLARGYEDAFCWALHADEVRAEKVRAAFTREEPEIRDFYDLQLLLDTGADFVSGDFIELVDHKLAEVGHVPLDQSEASFGLRADQRARLGGPGLKRLESVMRLDAPRFNLEALFDHFDDLWGKGRRK